MSINDGFAFGQSTLISGYLNTFAVDFANQVLFDGWLCHKILPQMLYSSVIGRHTSVIYLSGSLTASGWKLTTTEFVWTHPTCRPNGSAIPSQCPGCYYYRNWKIPPTSTGDKPVILTCQTTGCDGKYIVPNLTGFVEVGYGMMGTWKKTVLDDIEC